MKTAKIIANHIVNIITFIAVLGANGIILEVAEWMSERNRIGDITLYPYYYILATCLCLYTDIVMFHKKDKILKGE